MSDKHVKDGIARSEDYPDIYPTTGNFRLLTGRKEITTTERNITPTNIKRVLSKALSIHAENVSDITYLWEYYKGDQPILERKKEVRGDICNKIVENHADEIVSFKTGYAFGEPVTYAGRAEDDCAPAIAHLNAWNTLNDKATQDMDIGTWMHVCGQAYKFVCPRSDFYYYRDEEDDSPYLTESIDPREAFVVYYNGMKKVPVMGVKIVKVTSDDGLVTTDLYCCYTENSYYEIPQVDANNTLIPARPVPHTLRGIPIVEYPLNLARRGALEAVIPLLDAINNLQSNRLDGIEEFVQSLLLFHNVDVDAQDVQRLQQLGAIKYKDVEPSMPGEVKYITAELNQTGAQTLKEDLYASVLIIAGMPNRQMGATSTSDNVGSVIYRDGWSSAETKAKETEEYYRKSERNLLRIILRICRDTVPDFECHLSNIDIKFTRKNYENITAKANVLTMMLQNEKIAPRLAFINSGMFPDPEAAYQESKDYYEDLEREEKEDPAGGTGNANQPVE